LNIAYIGIGLMLCFQKKIYCVIKRILISIFAHYKTHYMKTAPPILPKNLKILAILGAHIQLARLRRKLSAEQVAERAGISRKTVYNIEQGIPTVAIGSYLQVLFVLGLEQDLSMVAATDPLGRKLHDAGITVAKRAPKKSNKP
jgi:DNA-binding XRE family transcriptional regulator